MKAIGFDIGGTLVNYNKPLNWSGSFKDALTFMCKNTNILVEAEKIDEAIEILQKYNTRVNPREYEVSSDKIFGEILKKWGEEEKINECKKSFYTFFQREVTVYTDAENILKYCKENGIKTSVYTDVAYGMDDEFSLKDIETLAQYIDLKLTSRNVGYRKPNSKGFEAMLKTFEIRPEEMLYVGDEEKDIIGAKSVGMKAILINRGNEEKQFNQDATIKSLDELVNFLN